MSDVGRFFNIDPLSEKYANQSHYNFSENRVVDARKLEGLEAVDFRKNDKYQNLVVVVQGWSGNTRAGYTQAQNRGDGTVDKQGLGALQSLSNSNTKAVAGASEGVDYGKMLTSTSEFDPSKTLYRGLSGKEAIKSEIYLTDNVEVAQSYVKNGQQVMQYDLSNSGLYMLEKTGELEFKTGINTGSTTISTEYLFKGKDLVKTINGKATPYNP